MRARHILADACNAPPFLYGIKTFYKNTVSGSLLERCATLFFAEFFGKRQIPSAYAAVSKYEKILPRPEKLHSR